MYAEKHGARSAGAAHEVKRALLSALAQRDPELSEHLDDVGLLAEQVARELGCPRALIERVRIAAELHDIGKMAIPESILSKPGGLSDGEWALMRQHTVAGERIIASSPALADVGTARAFLARALGRRRLSRRPGRRADPTRRPDHRRV